MKLGRKAGVTLFELLMAFAILALIALALAASMQLALRSYQAADRISAHDTEIALRIRLRLWLEAALPPSQIADFELGLEGTATKVSFSVLDLPSADPDAAATRVTVLTRGTELILNLEAMAEDGVVLNSAERVLARDINGVEISYFDPASDPPGWSKNWDEAQRMPALVRITIEPGSQPDWPDFIVRLAYN